MNKINLNRKERIIGNIRAVRCYLELSAKDFGVATGIGKRAQEFETGRFKPSNEEIQAIANLAEINPRWITEHVIVLKLEIY